MTRRMCRGAEGDMYTRRLVKSRRFWPHSLAARRRQHKARAGPAGETQRPSRVAPGHLASSATLHMQGGFFQARPRRTTASERRMRIGVPKETKALEGRVALVPAAVGDLVRRGHAVWIEQGAGLLSGFADADYERLGARIAPDAASLYGQGELIVKVKEPVEGDLALLRDHHLLFCYLHLAPDPVLARRLLDIGLTGIAFETVELDSGELPLLAPMSTIAGRIAVQVGTAYLHQPLGGKG